MHVAGGVPQHTFDENPPPVQRSPAGRHGPLRTATHFDPVHAFEQQDSGPVQSFPSCRQSAPPHVPPLHASEQQSVAR